MSVTKDQKLLRYGTQDGHQPTDQPMTSATSLYAGTIALTRAGYLVNADTVQSTDVCWGMLNGLKDGSPTVSSPIVSGSTNGDTIAGIDTGSFWLASGTSSDALTQADVGATVYVMDSITVGKTDGGGARPIAGKLEQIGSGQYAGKVAVLLGNAQSTGSP